MKIIALTGKNGNRLMIVVDHITCVESSHSMHGSEILVHLASGQFFSVKQSADEVLLAAGYNNGGQ